MSAKEEKSSYPSCNRAFALRMMNPCSYRQGQVSPLDREIQPVIKRSIARSVTSKSDGSTTSSIDTSLQDLDLYDIDENSGSLSASLDNAMLSKNDRSNLAAATGNGYLKRSLSSMDGFTKLSTFSRTAPGRVTLPARIRTKNASKNNDLLASQINSYIQKGPPPGFSAKSFINEYQARRNNALKGSSHGTNSYVNNSSTTRDRKSRGESCSDSRPKTPVKPVKVASTRSSELRVKHRSEGDSKNETASGSPRGHESNNKKGKQVNGYKGGNNYSSDYSLELDLKSNCSIAPSLSPSICSSPLVLECPPMDEFTKKLNDVCQLITEKHPSDFQILETLVNMQTAYENREQQIKMTITSLQHRINELEEKLRNSPNIPSLVIPMIRASSNFQKQLHKIVTSHKETLGKKESPSVNGYNIQDPLEEIYAEANNVAEQILTRQNSRRSLSDDKGQSEESNGKSNIKNEIKFDNFNNMEIEEASDKAKNSNIERNEDTNNTNQNTEDDETFV